MKKTTTITTLLLFIAIVLSNQTKAQSSCAWAKKASGTNEDQGFAVATDALGNVYYLGNFYSQSILFGTTTLHNQPYQASNYASEIFLVKYDSCGTFIWAKQAGGNNDAIGTGIATDATGNVYISGYHNCDTLTLGTVKLINGNYYNPFVAKYNSNGVAQWAVQGAGNSQARARSIAVDAAGNSYVTGSFNCDTLRFGSTQVLNGYSGQSADVFTAKFDNTGAIKWLKSGTGNYNDVAYGISIDGAGNVYVAGTFASNYIRFNTDSLALNSFNDIFVVKYDANGTEQWLRAAGGTDDDAAASIATDAAGNSYVTGYIGYSSTVSFGTHSITNSSASLAMFLVKYDANGNDLWARVSKQDYYTENRGYNVKLDAGGNPNIIGFYTSDSLNLGAVTLYNNSLLGGGGDTLYDVFVAKYKANGNLSWARSAGGTGNDYGFGIATGLNNSVYITGEYRSPAISFAGITLTSNNALGDAFIANNISTSLVTPDICLVSDDSIVGTNQYNVVYWDKTAYPNASAFVIYREVSTGVYKKIGTQPYGAISMFVDTARHVTPANGDPQAGTYKYTLQILDTSGTYSLMSPYHNTVYFQNNSGTFSWNLYTVGNSTYTPVTNFDLVRDDYNTGAWHIVSTVAGGQTSLTDPNYSTYQATANWRVNADGFNCTPTLRLAAGANGTMASKVASHSNQNNNRQAGIKQLLNNSNVSVYPNPNKGSFIVETPSTEKQTLQIFDVNGKLVFTQHINGNTTIDAANLADGVYNINIIGNGSMANKRLVIVK